MYLNHNYLSDKSAIALADSFKNSQTIEKLCLHKNSIQEDGYIMLAETLQNTSLKVLCVKGNHINYEVMKKYRFFD